MLTQEKGMQIAEYLAADSERAMKMMEMDPKDVSAAMQTDGFEVTADELKEFCEEFAKTQKSGELDEDALENVSGGACVWGRALEAAVGQFAYRLGYALW